MKDKILLSLCHMGGTEQDWVAKAFETNWIVPLGPLVNEFEDRLKNYLGANSVVSLSAGTAAIHIGLLLAGVKPGDEVICQSFTFSASANPIKYIGAKPVFVDSESDTWNMSPEALERAITARKKATGRYPSAIIPVHLYGMPAKMNDILAVANKYNIPVIEDAAEALGSKYHGKCCGTFGMYGILSFNGNKIITTSGGGALICPTERAAKKALFYATQAREDKPYYYHKEIGYNYRMSNVSAAIGCGQMDVLEDHVQRRRDIHSLYIKLFADTDGVKVMDNPTDIYDSNFWLTTITFDDAIIDKISPNEIREMMATENIETRLLWRPMHMQPIYSDAPFYATGVSEDLFNRGLCLPSGSCLTDDQIEFVAETLKHIITSA